MARRGPKVKIAPNVETNITNIFLRMDDPLFQAVMKDAVLPSIGSGMEF